MYQIAKLADGTHFRFHGRDNSGLRVSFDQSDAEQVWGVIPHPPADWTKGTAEWIAEYSASGGACVEIVSVHSPAQTVS